MILKDFFCFSCSRRSRQRRSDADEELLASYNFTALQDLLEDLIDHSDGEWYTSPVTKSEAPDYFEIVKKPLDLNKICSNLKQMKYKCNQEVIADIEQMFQNCFDYNQSETEVYKAGIRLKKYFEQVAQEFGLMRPEETKKPLQEVFDNIPDITKAGTSHLEPSKIEENHPK